MPSWLTEPAVVFDGVAFDHADLVLVGLLDGEWQRFVADLQLALAAERHAERDDHAGSDRGELLAMASTYRRERGLLSSEDLRSWLTARGLEVDDFMAHLRRALHLRAERERLSAGAGDQPVDRTAFEGVLRPEAILSGTLHRCGELLIAWAAAARAEGTLHDPADLDRAARDRATVLRELAAEPAAGLGAMPGVEMTRRAERLLRLVQSSQEFALSHADDEAIAQEIGRHRFQWQRIRWQETRVPTGPVSREMALCVRTDGMTLAEVAALAGVAVQRHDERFCELDAGLGGMLLATAPGELGGPYAVDDEFLLLWVDERLPPRDDDDRLRAMARANLVEAALERHRVGRVSWAGGI